jgi:hypothetical protein
MLRTGVETLPKVPASPRRYKLTTAVTFAASASQKDMDDGIAYITGSD